MDNEEKLPLKTVLPVLTKERYEKLFNRLHGINDVPMNIDESNVSQCLPNNKEE